MVVFFIMVISILQIWWCKHCNHSPSFQCGKSCPNSVVFCLPPKIFFSIAFVPTQSLFSTFNYHSALFFAGQLCSLESEELTWLTNFIWTIFEIKSFELEWTRSWILLLIKLSFFCILLDQLQNHMHTTDSHKHTYKHMLTYMHSYSPLPQHTYTHKHT